MRHILARRLWPCLVIAAALPLAAAQKSVVIPLLPAPVWRLTSTTKLPFQNLAAFGDNLAVDKELGVTAGGKRIYQMRNRQVTVIFERTADPSSAYSLFTLYRGVSMRPVKGIELAVVGEKFALMARGRDFIRVLCPATPALSMHELKALLIDIGGARLSVENADGLPTPLPARDLVPGTEKYMLGPHAVQFAYPSFPFNLIGFADGVEAKSAAYLSGGQRMVLFEISYPTAELARERFQQMDGVLHLGSEGVGSQPIYGRLDSSFALLVLNANSRAAAFHFLDRFVVSHIVSSVPAYPKKENVVGDFVKLLIANGELIGLIIIFSIVGGILIYGSKRLIMKVFPHSEWGRPDEDTLVRLKLRS